MPEIETRRLLMRAYMKEDADAHLRVVSDPEFGRYFPPPPVFQPTRDSVLVGIGRFIEHWNQLGFGVWALELKEGGRFIGYCGLRHLVPTDEVELLYGIDRAQWGTGLTTEAARASLRYGFEQMKFARVMAVTDPQNTGSRRVMEKCGLRYEKDAVYFDMNCVYYAINRGDFRADDAPYALRP
ncbi:MAG: GNAT family N-acetyltransferase [Acidobacteriota bacterium]|nr:GNAT family N-acetyltransferase [Acidobacteriota bacterium]